MPWKNQGGGPWGSGPKGPWGSGPQPVGPRPPDLEDLLRRAQVRRRHRQRHQPRAQASPGKSLGLAGRQRDFKAVLAGVARARDQAINAADFAKSEMIVADGLERNGGEVLQDLLGARALDRELRIARTGVFDFGVKLVVGDDVVEIRVLIAGIDAQQTVGVRNFMDEQVVNESAA